MVEVETCILFIFKLLIFVIYRAQTACFELLPFRPCHCNQSETLCVPQRPDHRLHYRQIWYVERRNNYTGLPRIAHYFFTLWIEGITGGTECWIKKRGN